MKNLIRVALVLFMLSVAGLLGLAWRTNHPDLGGGDFTLNSNGEAWVFTQHAKKLNLVYAGYAKCPDVCPMTLAFVAAAFRKLSPEEASRVQLIFVSVDHTHDTPADVQAYAAQFNRSFTGLTGTREQIDLTVNLLGASYILEEEPKSYLGYSITHSDRVYFLDNKGHVLGSEPGVRSEEQILNRIKEYL